MLEFTGFQSKTGQVYRNPFSNSLYRTFQPPIPQRKAMVHIFEILFLRHQLLANIRGVLLGYKGFCLTYKASHHIDMKVQKENKLHLLGER